MTSPSTYYKLVTANLVSAKLDKERKILQDELLAKSSDPVLCKRRFRMLSQLAAYESQIYQKIYNVDSDCLEDYINGAIIIIDEIRNVTDRNS